MVSPPSSKLNNPKVEAVASYPKSHAKSSDTIRLSPALNVIPGYVIQLLNNLPPITFTPTNRLSLVLVADMFTKSWVTVTEPSSTIVNVGFIAFLVTSTKYVGAEALLNIGIIFPPNVPFIPSLSTYRPVNLEVSINAKLFARAFDALLTLPVYIVISSLSTSV